MSGYAPDFSRSHRALAAERAGRLPASRAARALGLPVAFIRERCGRARVGGEWHHVSKFYNRVEYFDTEIIRAWMEGDEDSIWATPFVETFAAWQTERVAAGSTSKAKASGVVHEGVTVEWLEWTGPRAHPRATSCRAEDCTVTDRGGKYLAIRLPDGRTMKKGRDTRGFAVRVNGKQICL